MQEHTEAKKGLLERSLHLQTEDKLKATAEKMLADLRKEIEGLRTGNAATADRIPPKRYGAIKGDEVVLSRENFSYLLHSFLYHRNVSAVFDTDKVPRELVTRGTLELIMQLHSNREVAPDKFRRMFALMVGGDLCAGNGHYQDTYGPDENNLFRKILGSHEAFVRNLQIDGPPLRSPGSSGSSGSSGVVLDAPCEPESKSESVSEETRNGGFEMVEVD